MIKLENVCKYYDGNYNNKAVDNVSFSVEEQETLVLLGTSGCGKTSLLRMINRLTEATTGQIFVNGQDIRSQNLQMLRRGIGYVLQHHGLFPHYTVADNIAIVPNLLGWDKVRISKRTAELFEKLQLPSNIARLYPGALSGGQQQRVGLARALAVDPPVLLMDEPLGAVDPVTRAGIRNEFKMLDELKRKTIVLVTHDVQEAFELGDRVCLMDKGRIIQLGTAKELLFNPVNQFVSTFFKEQRLYLELKALQITDVWDLLPKAISGAGEKVLAPNTSLGDAIESMSTGQQPGIERFVTVQDGVKKQLEAASLMAAYSHVKNTASHA